MDVIKAIESEHLSDVAEFNIGDTVKVHYRIVEGKTERIQIYEGTVIARNNSGTSETFTVRKISCNVGVERVFPLHSPRIEQVELVRRGRIRRSKLYYLRGRKGKSAKIRELVKKKKIEKAE